MKKILAMLLLLIPSFALAKSSSTMVLEPKSTSTMVLEPRSTSTITVRTEVCEPMEVKFKAPNSKFEYVFKLDDNNGWCLKQKIVNGSYDLVYASDGVICDDQLVVAGDCDLVLTKKVQGEVLTTDNSFKILQDQFKRFGFVIPIVGTALVVVVILLFRRKKR